LRSALRCVDRHVWAGGIVTAVLSNFALLAAAFHFAGGGDGGAAALRGFPVFEVLGVCVGAEALGFLLVWTNMVKRYRSTFYQRRTLRQHVALSMWDGGKYTGRHGFSPDDSKGQVLKVLSRRYWPKDDVIKKWLRKHWSKFDNPATRPAWFNSKWLDMLPREWLPARPSMQLCDSGEALKRKPYRKLSVHRIYES